MSNAGNRRVAPGDDAGVTARAKRAIALKLRAHCGVLAVASSEEHRVLEFLGGLVAGRTIPSRRLVTWSVTEGFREKGGPFVPWAKDGGAGSAGPDGVQRLYSDLQRTLSRAESYGVDPGGAAPALADVVQGVHLLATMSQAIGPATVGALDRLSDPGVLFVLRDPGAETLDRPEVQRMLREIRHNLSYTRTSVVLLAPSWSLPGAVRDDISVERFPLPTPTDLLEVAREVVERMPPDLVGRIEDHAKLLQDVAESCRGMTLETARQAIEVALLDQRGLTPGVVGRVQEERRQIVGRSQALVIEEAKLTFADVRDLEALEEYVESRRHGFGAAAREYGLDAPKGVLLLGVPGGGKSAAAQAVARAWGLMLVRLNVGALFGGLVGKSEENLRQALEILDSLGPLLLWVDEVDKGFGGGGEGDSGTSLRVLQELLTWLQQRPGGTVCYFTANDISKVRPELLRKGRIDEIYFADLPGQSAREEILAVHLRRRGRPSGDIDLPAVAKAAEGYVGSELEQLVVDSMYRAKARGAETPGTEDLMAAVTATVPLARTYAPQIETIRRWVHDGRARRASHGEQVPLDRVAHSNHLSGGVAEGRGGMK